MEHDEHDDLEKVVHYQHTPTPWSLYPDTNVRFVELKLADYRYGAKCVNSHDGLVAALEDLVRRLDEEGYDFSGDVEQARKALADAKGTS